MTDLCPCCSLKNYQECCFPYHKGKQSENALILMRSRYSAYAKQIPDYIMRTTHPLSPYFIRNRGEWEKDILDFSQQTKFIRLEISSFEEGESVSYVTFIAYLESKGVIPIAGNKFIF